MAEHHGVPNFDQELADHVKDALLRSTESAGVEIRVAAHDGTVRLTGIVDVLSHRTVAEQVARQVPGVRRVENDITIANEEHVGDQELERELTGRLAHVPALRGVGCQVRHGRVELVGHVATGADEARAIQVAEGTPSVASVSSRLNVGVGTDEGEAGTSRHAGRLLDQMGLDAGSFQLYTAEGKLVIKGFVRNEAQKKQVIRMLERLDGVERVDATLVTDAELGGEVH